MSKNREQFKEAVAFIKEDKIKPAMDILDILLLKDQKNIDYNLTMGLCHKKISDFAKAEFYYKYCLEKKPDDAKIMKALFQLYKDDLKQPQLAIQIGKTLIEAQKKTDKAAACETQVEYCKVLRDNQERKLLDEQFLDLLHNGQAEHACKVAQFYIPLLIDLKLIDPSQPTKYPQLCAFSAKLFKNQINFTILEEIMKYKVVQRLKDVYNEQILAFAPNERYFHILMEWLKLFPQSCVLLDEVLKYVHCFLDLEMKFVLEQCILLLVHNEYSDLGCHSNTILFQNYPDFDQYQLTARKAKAYISFLRNFASEFLVSQGSKYQQAVNALMQSKQIDILEGEKDLLFLEVPVKVAQLYKSGQAENQAKANQMLSDFNKKMKNLKRLNFECSLLEEISANLGFEILSDPIELMEMKNLLKVRIKNKAFSIETYEKYFDYQIKLVSLIRQYDEELPMQLIFDKILQDNPNNSKIQIHYAWLQYSEKKISKEELVQRYQKIRPSNIKEEALILKRLGTIKCIEKDLDAARECFEKGAQLAADDYEMHLSLGILEYLRTNYTESLERLYRAFNICQTNYHLNQIITFILNKIGMKEKALEFAVNIYRLPTFANVFWLSFTIGHHLMQSAQFYNAHEILQKAADQYHFNLEKTYLLYYEKKLDFDSYSIPYFIHQNDNCFLCDYPVFSSSFYEQNNMLILCEKYFQQNKYVKLFNLEMKLAELKKILGLQGSALKSIEKAEQILLIEPANQAIGSLDEFLTTKKSYGEIADTLIRFAQQYNQIQLRSRWVCTSDIRKIDVKYAKLLIQLNFEAAQLYLFQQNEYYSQERMIQGILMSIKILSEDPNDHQTNIMVRSYLPFVFEIAIQQMKQERDHFSKDSSIMLGKKYLELLDLVKDVVKNNTYTNECFRDFYYLLGTLVDKKYFNSSINFSMSILHQLCQIQSEDLDEMFQQIRSVLQGQDKKALIIKNNLHSLLLSMKRLKLDCTKFLTLAISLFPKSETFYIVAAQIYPQKAHTYIHKAVACNPKSQQALFNLGVVLLQEENYSFAYQAFQKCIEIEPTTSSYSYLGISLIGFIYLQDNENIELQTSIHKQKQFELVQQFQSGLRSQIASYLDYVTTLKNLPLQNILAVVFRAMYLGTTIKSDALIEELNLNEIPEQFQILVKCQQECNIRLLNSFKEFQNAKTLSEECSKTLALMQKPLQFLKWAQLLKYLLNLKCLEIEKLDDLKQIQASMQEFFSFLIEKIKEINQAICVHNYDAAYLQLIDTWYHKVRTLYLNSLQNRDYYLFVSNFKQACLELQETQGTQLICYVDMLQDKKHSRSEHLEHKLRFMEHMVKNQIPEAKRSLQLAILNDPQNYTYRNVLNRLNDTFKPQVTRELLELNQSDQSINWLNIVVNELVKLRQHPSCQHEDRISFIIRIAKYKILPYSDDVVKRNTLKVLQDCLVSSKLHKGPILELISSIKLDGQKYRLRSQIQQAIHSAEFALASQLILEYKVSYIDQLEDVQNSKKTVQFLMPVVMQLYLNDQSEHMSGLISSALQYAQYTQQFLLNDEKIRRLRFIYCCLLYHYYIHQIENQETIAETLTKLKDISDEFLAQGIYNPLSISMFIHYTIATEKPNELREWISNVTSQIYNFDDIIQWANIVNAYNLVSEQKTTLSFKQLMQEIERQKLKQQSLVGLSYFLMGQAMMNVHDWHLTYSKEVVLKKFQLACLWYPSKQIAKCLEPLKCQRQRRTRLSRLKAEEFLKQEKEKQQKKVSKTQDGLNSDSDEQMIDWMDYQEDQLDLNPDQIPHYHVYDPNLEQQEQGQVEPNEMVPLPEGFHEMTPEQQFVYLSQLYPPEIVQAQLDYYYHAQEEFNQQEFNEES